MNSYNQGQHTTGIASSPQEAQQATVSLHSMLHQAQQLQQARQQPWANYTPKKYMINGVLMDFTEFTNTIFPDDSPEKTMFLLKFQKETTDVNSN